MKNDIGTIENLLTDCNWCEVFGEGTGGNCDKKTDACPPTSTVDLTEPTRADVVKIIGSVNGKNEESEWIGVFKLKDGRFLLATGSCDYTGWDCRAGNNLEVAFTLKEIMQYGLDESQKTRLEKPA